MKETQLLGKLLPSHPDILPVLVEIREKYQIPEISPTDNSLKILLEYDLEIDWKAVHAEILEKLKESDFLPDKTKKMYNSLKKLQSEGVHDPEFEKVSEEFKKNVLTLFDLFLKQYEPIITEIDNFYREIANRCIEYLMIGETREVPQNWLAIVDVMEIFGDKVVFAMANQATDPDVIAELFKEKYANTFGKHRPKLTEKHINSVDFLRMKWEGKPIAYILEEEEIRNPKDFPEGTATRHSTATRKRHAKMRQKLHRLQKTLNEILK
jgi:hypothetical protein